MTIEFLRKIITCITIVNFNLWKCRNDYVHQQEDFEPEKFITRLTRTIGARKRLQLHPSISEVKKIPRIDDIFSAIVTLQNVAFPHDNG